MEGTKKAAGEAAGKGVYVDAYQKKYGDKDGYSFFGFFLV